jgi:hypothetical protein
LGDENYPSCSPRHYDLTLVTAHGFSLTVLYVSANPEPPLPVYREGSVAPLCSVLPK